MAVINSTIKKMLQYRIEQEELSSRIYEAMSNWLDFNGFAGAGKLWKKYSEEELVHAEKVYVYMRDLDVMPIVTTIPEPEFQFTGLQQVIAKSYQHELEVTNQCNVLAKAALSENDFMTHELALWFLKEQREELSKIQYWLDRLSAFGDSPVTLRMLDEEMAEA